MTKLITTSRVPAILTIVLGVVHEAMTFHPMIADGFLATPLIAIGAFAAANGILATCFMFDNPFAWAVFVFGIALFVILILIRVQHQKQ